MQRRYFAVFVVAMLLAFDSIAAQVVGFKLPFERAYVAVRCRVTSDTVVRGITFFSNDATVFPEVAVMSDAVGGQIPRFGSVVRSVQGVVASPGRVCVEFEPYWCADTRFLWLVVRFPRDVLTRDGDGGGPGIGWIPAPNPLLQRSFYCVDGDIGEFGEGLDVSLLTEATAVGAPMKSGALTGPVESLRLVLKPTVKYDGSVDIDFRLGSSGPTSLMVFDVAGRHVRTLVDGALHAGNHHQAWDGRLTSGARVARGIYVLLLRTQRSSAEAKVLMMR